MAVKIMDKKPKENLLIKHDKNGILEGTIKYKRQLSPTGEPGIYFALMDHRGLVTGKNFLSYSAIKRFIEQNGDNWKKRYDPVLKKYVSNYNYEEPE